MSVVRENTFRTMMCAEVTEKDISREVVLSGWAASYRDHGGLIFIDLRDRTGIVQVVIDPKRAPEAHKIAEKIRAEFVLRVNGRVASRPPGGENPKLKTGWLEIEASSLEILNTCPPIPFAIEDGIGTSEDTRLQYRYLDLRRPEMTRMLLTRHKFVAAVRSSLDKLGFCEVETPFLGKSTPEGARDYLVPARLSPGMFYALPQSPQLYKQLLMVGGLDRYYQIARCMRDEDLRKDRQPEFTQIDIEMSFPEMDDIFLVTEQTMQAAFAAVGIEIQLPFERVTHKYITETFGSDKADMRYGLPLVDVSDIARKSGANIFSDALKLDKKGRIKALVAGGWGKKSRKDMDLLTARAQELGAKGLAWVKVGENASLSGGVSKFFPGDLGKQLVDITFAKPDDMILIVADKKSVTHPVLNAFRTMVAESAGLIDPKVFLFRWVTDFPLFQYDEEEKRWVSEHHPFTRPHPEDLDLVDKDPGNCRSGSYDLVVNGYECASGSIRIHDSELQQRIFRRLEFTNEEIQRRFGFFTNALTYGAPPHGGIALGIDRLMAIILNMPSIRDVIAFPKNQKGVDLMTGAPSSVDDRQLRELYIKSTAGEAPPKK
jgi:aspartyl-tRNA synthetase